MDALGQLLALHEANSENMQPNTLATQFKQILSDSTNTQLKNSQTSSNDTNTHVHSARRRRQSSVTLATIRRYKEITKHKNSSEPTPVHMEILDDIQKFQQNDQQRLSNEDQIQQRAMYNARQTPLIPLIADLDSSLPDDELSEYNDDLVMKIINLISNTDEECSFFEQFKI